MNINDIIGKGKDFEPPFRVRYPRRDNAQILDGRGKFVAQANDQIAEYICELLNRKHKGSNQRMCLRDRSKVCNLCHDCDVDVLNPGNRIQSR